MYDYATGKWAPVRFYDYVAKKWIDAVPSTTVEIPEGAYDPVLGTAYIQLAREGLGQQKSQNGGTGVPLSGEFKTPYHRYGSRVPSPAVEHSFFDGINISLARNRLARPGPAPIPDRRPKPDRCHGRPGHPLLLPLATRKAGPHPHNRIETNPVTNAKGGILRPLRPKKNTTSTTSYP